MTISHCPNGNALWNPVFDFNIIGDMVNARKLNGESMDFHCPWRGKLVRTRKGCKLATCKRPSTQICKKLKEYYKDWPNFKIARNKAVGMLRRAKPDF